MSMYEKTAADGCHRSAVEQGNIYCSELMQQYAECKLVDDDGEPSTVAEKIRNEYVASRREVEFISLRDSAGALTEAFAAMGESISRRAEEWHNEIRLADSSDDLERVHFYRVESLVESLPKMIEELESKRWEMADIKMGNKDEEYRKELDTFRDRYIVDQNWSEDELVAKAAEDGNAESENADCKDAGGPVPVGATRDTTTVVDGFDCAELRYADNKDKRQDKAVTLKED